MQVIHVGGEESIDEARVIAPFVDALLLDSGNQKLAVKELGGTGRVHDWRISRRIRDAVDRSAVPRRRIECGKRRRGRGRRAATRRRCVQRCAHGWEAGCREGARVRRGMGSGPVF